MGGIIRTALRYRLLVAVAAAGLLGVGLVSLRDAPVDVLPEFTPTYAEIQTEALGLSATEVENLITVPLEADLLNGVEGVDVIRSESLPGLSSVVLVFTPGTDVYRARQLVQERLAQAHALPRVSKPPTLLPPLSSASRVVMVGLSSDRVSPIEKSIIARWTIRPRLMGVPGVANVAMWGLRDEQVQVLVRPEHLRDRNVTLDQVVRTAGNAQIVSPLTFLQASTPGAGGFIETPQQRLQVRNVLERLADPAELGKVPVEETQARLRLRDVADLKIGHQPLIGDAVVGDGDGLLLVVEKFPGADTVEVTEGVEAALETLKPGLSGMRVDTSVFRPASYIEDAIGNVGTALLIGGLLLLAGIAALLLQWRSVLIAAVTIPLSLVAAALVLDAFGQTLNALSVAGLMLALAVLVDDAVVASEGVAARLRSTGRAQAVHGVVLGAIQDQRRPLGYAALIALLAVVPIAIMNGRPGAFFEPVALAFAAAIVIAAVVALTVTPVLVLLLFSRGRPRHRTSPVAGMVRSPYERTLRAAMRRPSPVIAAAVAAVALALAVLPTLGAAPVPAFKDRDLLVRLEGAPGTSNTRMTEVARGLTRTLRALPGVESAGAHVGRAVTGDQRVDVNSSDVWARIAAGADYDATVERIRAAADTAAGVESEIQTYSTSRIREVGTLRTGGEGPGGDGLAVLTGSDEGLVARVYGHDLAELERQAARVRDVMAGVEGVADPRVDQPEEQPNVVIEVDLARAQRFGIKPGDVRRAEATLVQGIHVGSVFDDQRVIDVIVQGTPETRQSVGDIRNLLVDRPGGGHVRLGRVADVRIEPTPVAIRREAVSRYLDVAAGVSGRGAEAVADDLRGRLADLEFPLEYHVEVADATTADELGATTVLISAGVAAIAAFLLLQAAFQSWGLALAGFLLLPVGLSGGVLAARLADGEMSLGAALGLIALLALGVRMTLLSVRRFQELEWPAGNVPIRSDHVAGTAQERLVPIVASAASVALVLLPMVVLGARAGLEILHPMAVVLLGGLVTTTFAAALVLPVLYLRFAVSEPRAQARWQPTSDLRWSRLRGGAVGNGRSGAGADEPAAADPPRAGER